MVSVLVSRSSGPGSSPDWGHFTLTVPPFHPGVQMGTGKFNAGGNPAVDYSCSIQSRSEGSRNISGITEECYSVLFM